MARLPRLAIGGHLHHVLQRGGHGQPVCQDTHDYETLLSTLFESARQHGVEVHGYALLPDHFHLLLTPPTDVALPLMMQALGRSYVRYVNQRYGRRGTLWEGRFKSAVLQPSFALQVLTFFDTHPQRSSGPAPTDASWSSFGHYSGARLDKRLSTHPAYWELGNTPFAREAAYQAAASEGLTTLQRGTITDTVTRAWALGDAGFVDGLQKLTARRLVRKAAGRPAAGPKKA
jgi:putative transposase